MNMQEPETLGRPPFLSGYYRFGKRYRLHQDACLVYGSNLRGINGAGVAKLASLAFDAKFGVAEGYNGRAYALPTKYDPKTSLPINKVREHVKTFLSATDISTILGEYDPHHPFLDDFSPFFYVTPVGTGLAGFTHAQIAPMFEGAVNCWLPDIWEPYLGPAPGLRREYQEEYCKQNNIPFKGLNSLELLPL